MNELFKKMIEDFNDVDEEVRGLTDLLNMGGFTADEEAEIRQSLADVDSRRSLLSRTIQSLGELIAAGYPAPVSLVATAAIIKSFKTRISLIQSVANEFKEEPVIGADNGLLQFEQVEI